MERVIVALGGNQGDVTATFRQAANALQSRSKGQIQDLVQAGCYRSEPMGADAGTAFVNSAFSFLTDMSPLMLLDALQAVEQQLGRKRTMHWGPRTLDLDLILYGTQVIDHPRLQVPHPHCWYRRFVLDPVAALCPDAVHPGFELTMAELRARLLVRPLVLQVAGDVSPSDCVELQRHVQAMDRGVELRFCGAMDPLADDPAGDSNAAVFIQVTATATRNGPREVEVRAASHRQRFQLLVERDAAESSGEQLARLKQFVTDVIVAATDAPLADC